MNSSTDRGDQGEFAAPGRLTEVQGLGAKNPLGVPGLAVAPPATFVVVMVNAVVAAEDVTGGREQLTNPRSFDSGASVMTVVTSREKNSSIV